MRFRRLQTTAWTTLFLMGSCADRAPTTTATGDRPLFSEVLTQLLSQDPEVRSAGFESARESWSRFEKRFFELGQSKRTAERLAAAFVISRLADPNNQAVVEQMLADRSAMVRVVAIEGIVKSANRNAIPQLERLAEKAEYDELRHVFAALAALAPDRTRKRCVAALGHDSWMRRRVAIQTLATIGREDVEARLLEALQDPNWSVRADAVEALGKRRVRASREPLLRLLGSDHARMRGIAVRALGRIGTASDVASVLRIATSDDNRRVRSIAAHSLADFPKASALPALEKLLNTSGNSPDVEVAAIESVASLGGERATALLESARTRAGAVGEAARAALHRNQNATPVR